MRIGILLLVLFLVSCRATVKCKKEVVCSPLVYDLKTGKHHLYCFPVVVCSYGGKEFYLEAGEYIAIRSASGYKEIKVLESEQEAERFAKEGWIVYKVNKDGSYNLFWREERKR